MMKSRIKKFLWYILECCCAPKNTKDFFILLAVAIITSAITTFGWLFILSLGGKADLSEIFKF